MGHHAEEEFAVCCLTLVKKRNWEAPQIGQMLEVWIPQQNQGVATKVLFV